MKRPLTLLLSLALILALTACGGAGSDPSGNGDAPPGGSQQDGTYYIESVLTTKYVYERN